MSDESLKRTWLDKVTKSSRKPEVADLRPGDQVRVWQKIQERDRVRLAPFEGIVVRCRGGGISETLTVRRVTFGEGVERVFPLHAPVLDHVEIIRRGKVRRARLYYLRTKVGKTRIAEANPSKADVPATKSEPPQEPPAAPAS